MLGCASAPFGSKVFFTPWTLDEKSWTTHEINGIHFRVPPELLEVQYSDESAFCLSAYKSDLREYVPAEALYILHPKESRLQADLEPYISVVKSLNGIVEPISSPVSGYQFWLPASYSNKNNSRKIQNDSTVSYVNYGYMFIINNKPCKVYMHKYFNRAYREINIDQIISLEEKALVKKVAASIN